MKANDMLTETASRDDEWSEQVPADCIPNGSNLLAGRSPSARAYLRHLRAAEMAAWESSGGDYLLSRCARRAYAQ
jgi:hypothetical protein